MRGLTATGNPSQPSTVRPLLRSAFARAHVPGEECANTFRRYTKRRQNKCRDETQRVRNWKTRTHVRKSAAFIQPTTKSQHTVQNDGLRPH
eukprot:5576536-Alexandrium_andersonii.AAC.1